MLNKKTLSPTGLYELVLVAMHMVAKEGYYVAGPPLLNGRCTSLLRAPHLQNDLYCVECDVKP